MFHQLPDPVLPETEAWDSFRSWVTVCLTDGLPGGPCNVWDNMPELESNTVVPIGHVGMLFSNHVLLR